MSGKYLLVDLSNFIFRFVNKRGQAEQIADEIASNIHSFASSLLCSQVILFQDFKGSDYRKKIYPEYKGNRKRKEGKFQEQMDKFFKKMPTITKILNIQFPLICYKGIEADDIIYWATKHFEKTVILSTDADLLQCGVPQFSFTKKRYLTLEEQGFDTIEAFVQAKAIAGDSSDNIKGLERVGLKTVKKYFEKYNVSTFAELRAKIPKNTKSKIEQRVLGGSDVFARNLQLVDLSLPCLVTKELCKEIIEDINEFK